MSPALQRWVRSATPTRNFDSEFLHFLKKHGIVFDPQYALGRCAVSQIRIGITMYRYL